MRTRLEFFFFLGAILPILSPAAWTSQKIPDQQKLALLELRASQAPADDQCFLYAELVHETVEYSAHQYASGNVEEAKVNLKRTQLFTQKIRTILNQNVKRLKRAEILLRRTAFRLTDFLHGSRYEDRPLVKETLSGVEGADREMMMQLFKK